MRYIGEKNLIKYIKHSNKNYLRKKFIFERHIKNFLIVCILQFFHFYIRINDADIIKDIIKSSGLLLVLLEAKIFTFDIFRQDKVVRRMVDHANKKLEELVNYFREQSINTSIENLKQAKIDKSEKMDAYEYKILPVSESLVSKAMKTSIQLFTLEGELINLKQCRALILQSAMWKERQYLFLEEENETKNKDNVAVRGLVKKGL